MWQNTNEINELERLTRPSSNRQRGVAPSLPVTYGTRRLGVTHAHIYTCSIRTSLSD